jgi:tetratricopeptide (TPR) repeat protein
MHRLSLTLVVGLTSLVTTATGADARSRTRPRPTPAAEARRASADPKEQARALVSQGAAEIRSGDYVKALDLFSRAYALFPSPKILFNLAQTYKELGRFVEALAAYERFLGTDAKETAASLREEARKQVQQLKSRVATILLDVSEPGALIRIDGTEVGLSPMDMPHRVLPGKHVVVVSKEGFLTGTADLELTQGQRLVHVLKLQRPREKIVVRQVVYRVQRKPRQGLPLLWTGIGITAAAALGLAFTGSLTLYFHKVYANPANTVARRDAAVRLGSRWQWAAEGCLAAAGAAAIFTTVWGLVVVRRSGGIERIPVDERPVTVTPTGTGLVLSGRF